MPERPGGSWPGGGPEDPLEVLSKVWEDLRRRFGGTRRGRFSPWLIVAIALPLYALSGIFIVAPDERGVVLRFGRVVREADPGPGYHLPWPVEQVLKPSVTQIRKAEFGFRTVDAGPPARYRDEDVEALMLTGDNNIDNALTEGKELIQEDAQRLLQEILDRYQVGLEVAALKLQDVDPPDQVSDAFKDVISAQQDKERLINEATGYANDVVPKARGQAAQLINEAEGDKDAKVQDAAGGAAGP